MAREQTLTIKIDGIEESIKNLKTIKDAIDGIQKAMPAKVELTKISKGVTQTVTEMTDKATGDILKVQTLVNEVSAMTISIQMEIDPKTPDEVKKGMKEKFKEINEELTKVWTSFNAGLTTGFKALSDLTTMEKDAAVANLKEVTEKYTKAAEGYKKSSESILALENKVKNARGGRSVALQEQINAEMAVNQQLAAQEKKLAQDKAKAEKEKEKHENRLKRQGIQKGIIESVANIGLGITKAMSLGMLGLPFAAIIAAAGAAQIAVQVKQLSKLADGGMLRGRRHSEGGMRIEGTNIEVEGGEYVVNRESTDRNMGLIRYINSERRQLSKNDINSFFAKTARGYEPAFRRSFAEGGQMPALTEPSAADNGQLVDAIRNIKFEPKVAVTDIVRAQESMTSVDAWVGI